MSDKRIEELEELVQKLEWSLDEARASKKNLLEIAQSLEVQLAAERNNYERKCYDDDVRAIVAAQVVCYGESTGFIRYAQQEADNLAEARKTKEPADDN